MSAAITIALLGVEHYHANFWVNAFRESADVAIADGRVYVADFGNTGAAGAPSVVSMRWDSWEDGDDIAVVGVGSGLTWSSFLLRFGETA